ncbi:MAG: non-hydrolyzing UDP-N-acetylglucosamine 2-epimerase [Myxococcota bacterium]
MKVATIVGARPQFIKAAPVSRALAEGHHEEVLIHTGQHYDTDMSDVFFAELPIPTPSVNLEVGSSTPGRQTGEILIRVEEVLAAAVPRPDWVLVYGDTNSTLGGALAARKCGISLAHIEAGLRSFNPAMPEEHNRVLVDHCSQRLFCPTRTAVENLAAEGIATGVHQVGDTMLDAVLQFSDLARERSTILRRLGLERGGYLLATIHRNYNTDDPGALARLVGALESLGEAVVFPVHPRTRKELEKLPAFSPRNLRPIEPVAYLDMLELEAHARGILTDSGGMQKEAFFLGVPCVTLRPETEWVETVASGWNTLTGSDPDRLRAAVASLERPPERPADLFGAGDAAAQIVRRLAASGSAG